MVRSSTIIVFDDWFSLFHFLLGYMVSVLGIWSFIVFVVYEILSFCFKRSKETIESFLGDFFEYFVGSGTAHLLLIAVY